MAFDSTQPGSPGASGGLCTPAPQTRIGRLFSRWGTVGSATGVNPTPMQVNQTACADNQVTGPSGSDGEPCWWTVAVNAREVIRRAALPADVTAALPENVVRASGLDTSKLWAEARWTREGIGNRVVFDIGAGMRISVEGCNVSVGIITPPETRVVSNNQRYEYRGTGTYLDTIWRASVVAGCAAIRHEALLTQTLVLGPGTTVFVPQPPGSVGVEIYVPGANAAGLAAAGNWVEFGDLSGTAIPGGFLGLIPFLTVAAERTGIVSRPGNAAGVASTNNTESTLVYTYVWHLEF